MLYWSNRNFLYNSRKAGWLLWVGNTGSVVKLSCDLAEAIRESPVVVSEDLSTSSINRLMRVGAIHPNDCDEFDKVLRMEQARAKFASDLLSLTIAVTSRCNFACSYCIVSDGIYEKYSDMSFETCDALISYIKKTNKKKVILVWYGGEPLLAIDKIDYLSRRLNELEISIEHRLITNGYLLDDDITSKFYWRYFRGIQITLDGLKESHNKRRPHKVDGDSFTRIIKNIDKLLAHPSEAEKKTEILIRVNIDKGNIDNYFDVKKYVKEKYGVRISVYPGFVQNSEFHCNSSFAMTTKEKAQFALDVYEKTGEVLFEADLRMKRRAYYPCDAAAYGNYVLDWNGVAYKCWDDLGIKEKSIFDLTESSAYNRALEAKYVLESDLFNDIKCKKCPIAFICSGGCPNVRLRENTDRKSELCHPMSQNLEAFLDILYCTHAK